MAEAKATVVGKRERNDDIVYGRTEESGLEKWDSNSQGCRSRLRIRAIIGRRCGQKEGGQRKKCAREGKNRLKSGIAWTNQIREKGRELDEQEER